MGNSIAEGLLFQQKPVKRATQDSIDHTRQDVQDLPPGRLLDENIEDLVDQLFEERKMAVPELQDGEDEVTYETGVEDRHIETGRAIALKVPYVGDMSLFKFRPGRLVTNAPRANLERGELELIYRTEGNVEEDFQEDIERIRSLLEHTEDRVESYHTKLRNVLRQELESRKEELEQEKETAESLPFSPDDED